MEAYPCKIARLQDCKKFNKKKNFRNFDTNYLA